VRRGGGEGGQGKEKEVRRGKGKGGRGVMNRAVKKGKGGKGGGRKRKKMRGR